MHVVESRPLVIPPPPPAQHRQVDIDRVKTDLAWDKSSTETEKTWVEIPVAGCEVVGQPTFTKSAWFGAKLRAKVQVQLSDSRINLDPVSVLWRQIGTYRDSQGNKYPVMPSDTFVKFNQLNGYWRMIVAIGGMFDHDDGTADINGLTCSTLLYSPLITSMGPGPSTPAL